MSKAKKVKRCPLCEREDPALPMERHHLKARRAGRETKRVCRECHKAIHCLYEDRELKRGLPGTVEGLLADDAFQAALVHIRKVPPGTFMRMRERRKR